MRSVIVNLAAAGIAALVSHPAKADELRHEVRAAIVACMLQSEKPRPFKVADSKSWNDYNFEGLKIEFFSVEAGEFYEARCKQLTIALAASSQDQSGLNQVELVRCMIKQAPDLVEGHDGEKRDYIRRPNVVEYTSSRAADVGKKCTTELSKK